MGILGDGTGLFSKVLQGLGAGLIKQGEFDEKQQEQQLLMDREIALKQVDHQQAVDMANVNLTNRLTEIDRTAQDQQQTDLVQGVITNRRDATKHQYDTQDLILKGNIDLTKDKAIENLRAQNQLTYAGYQNAIQLKSDLKRAGVEIDHWAPTNNGGLMAFNKLGKPLELTQTTGGFHVSGTQDEGLPGISGTGGIGPKPTTQPVPQTYNNIRATTNPQATSAGTPASSGGRAAALAALGNAYAEATQNPGVVRSKYPGLFDTSGNLRPQADLISQVNQQYPN